MRTTGRGALTASAPEEALRLSPIALTAVVAAAAAVAVVVGLQTDDPGRVSARDALATPIAGSDDARLTMTLVNEGGDDRIVGLAIPIAEGVRLVGADAGGEGAGAVPEDAAGAAPGGASPAALDVPARSSVTLDGNALYILAAGVDWTAAPEGRIPLSIRLERSDAITVFVDVAPPE